MPRNNGNWMAAHPKTMYAGAKAYHRLHPWDLNGHGLMVPHDYSERKTESLSWWDDVGFIFGKRRIMVWWMHPRMVYRDRLDEMAFQQCDKAYPRNEIWRMHSKPIRRKGGYGKRPKTFGYLLSPLYADEHRRYYEHLNETQALLAKQDHGWVIQPSLKSTVLNWCQGIDLVLPVEICCEDDLRCLREVVERYLRGDRSVLSGYSAYTFADWQSDQETLANQAMEPSPIG